MELSKGTITRWGLASICAVSDYNGQESTVLLTALNTMNDSEPDGLMNKIQRVLSIDEVMHKVGQETAKHMQNEDYASTKQNVLKNWAILIAFCALYVLIGLIFLEFIDHDKR
jgi:hypothetical protein